MDIENLTISVVRSRMMRNERTSCLDFFLFLFNLFIHTAGLQCITFSFWCVSCARFYSVKVKYGWNVNVKHDSPPNRHVVVSSAVVDVRVMDMMVPAAARGSRRKAMKFWARVTDR